MLLMCRVTDDDDKHQRPLLVWPQPSTLCVGGPVLKCTSYNLAPLDCGLAGRRKPRPWPNKFTNRRIITGPRNGPVLFCSLASVIVVCNAAGRQPGRPAAGCAGSRYSMAGQSWYVSLGRQLVRYRYLSVCRPRYQQRTITSHRCRRQTRLTQWLRPTVLYTDLDGQ